MENPMKKIDLHCDTLSKLVKAPKGVTLSDNQFDVDINGLKRAGIVIQFFASYVDGKAYPSWDLAYQDVIKMLDRLEIEQNADLKQAFSYADIVENIKEHRISAVATVEEGGILNGDISRISKLYDRGVRLITLTWNYENCIGYPNSPNGYEMSEPLKPFGFQVIEEMNRAGMLIDVSHLSEGGFWDCINHSKAPICASHSNARALCDHPRNLTDDMLMALAEKGGVAGLNFVPKFLNPDTIALCIDIALHAKHMIQVAGEDIVAFGADLDGFSNQKRENWVNKVSDMNKIIPSFKKVGLTERQIDKICFENANRVIKEVLK
jgi:membrane dipeptidase